jgi:quercetin 2,3-dioxygenase
MFVNLPASHKLVPPAMGHALAHEMPTLTLGDATGKLVFGRYGDVAGPNIPAPGDATLIDISLGAGQSATLTLGIGQQGVVIVIAGALAAPHDARAFALAASAGAAEAESMTLTAAAAGARMAWLSGTPWREPLVQHGPFGMSTEAQLRDAIARYHAGEMGQLQALSA